MSQPFDENYWSNRYTQNQTGWDIGYPSTPLKSYIDQLTNKDLCILVPGCGNAYEVEYLLEKGFKHVTAIDISPVLTGKLAARFSRWNGRELTILTGDFFGMEGHFDLILEQTFFCALDPALRPRYVETMFRLLKPGGKLAGVLFNRAFEGGPPFGGNMAEYEELFSRHFRKVSMEPCYNSIDQRKGAEIFIRMVPAG